MGRKGKGRQLSRLAALPLISGYNKVRDSAYAIEGNRVYHTEVPSNRRPLLLGVVQEQRNQEPHKGKEQHDSRYSVQHKKRKARERTKRDSPPPKRSRFKSRPKSLRQHLG